MSHHSSSSSSDNDHDGPAKELAKKLISYCFLGNVTFEGLQEIMEDFPVETIEDAIVKSNILPIVLNSEHVTLDVVTHLVNLAPTVGNSTVEIEEHLAHWFLLDNRCPPLHIACKNRECPESVIKFLLEKYPSAAGQSWTDELGRRGYSGGFPLHCYLMRAIKREAYDECDDGTGDLIYEHPEIPGQQLDYDTVEMLVQACPEALTTRADLGNPMTILCHGCTISLELARLLTDEEQKCFDAKEGSDLEGLLFPMRCLLQNHDFESFPTDVFRYFMECSPSSLRQKTIQDDSFTASMFTDTPLHIACSNPKISVEVIQIIIDECPFMVREAYAVDGFLPLHNLCCNEDLDDESSMAILQMLVDAFPESVRTNAVYEDSLPEWCAPERGEDDLPIHYACRYKSFDFCRYLIEKHPESVTIRQLHYSDEEKMKGQGSPMLPFHLACKYGQLDLIQYLLEQYPEALFFRTVDRQLPIHLAMQYSDESTFDGLSFLAHQKPDSLSVLDERGMSCAHYACLSKNALKKLELIAVLCPEAFRCHSDQCGLPIHHACYNGCDEEVLRYLISQYPESLGIHVGSLGSPLHCALEVEERRLANEEFPSPSPEKVVVLLRFLLKEKYRTGVESGVPIVYSFVRDNELQNKDRILAFQPFDSDEGAEEDEKGRTLAHLIFYVTKYVELIKKNLRYPDMLSKQDHDGWLPLHHAMRNDASPETVRFLLDEHPEHAQVTDNEGRTPFHLACRWKQTTKIEVLVDVNPELVRDGMLSKQDQNGWLPLHHAMTNAYIPPKSVRFLLDEHPEHVHMTDNKGRTPLHIACHSFEKTVMKMKVLLEGDPELVRVTDNHGRTALHYACLYCQSKETLTFLLEQNSDIAAVDREGDLPLHIACRRGCVRAIEFLMAEDMTSVYARNNSNELPIHLLSSRCGKKDGLLESTEYTGAILKLLLAYPETVDL